MTKNSQCVFIIWICVVWSITLWHLKQLQHSPETAASQVMHLIQNWLRILHYMFIFHAIILYGVWVNYRIEDLESPPNTWSKAKNDFLYLHLVLFTSTYKCRESYRYLTLSSGFNIAILRRRFYIDGIFTLLYSRNYLYQTKLILTIYYSEF